MSKEDGTSNATAGANASAPSTLKRIATALLLLFFVIVLGLTYFVYTAYQQTKSFVTPLGEFAKQLVLPATPVILVDPMTIVLEVNDIARLETASLSLQKVVTVKRNNDFLWGTFGETLIFVGYGDVIAGVDLEKMSVEDVQVTGPNSVTIHLPAAEILVTKLDNEQSYVADRDVGWLANADPQLETQVRQMAESAMVEEAMGMGVLNIADQNAQIYMTTFLKGFGFTDITFVDETPPPAPPYEQVIPKGYELETTATPTP